MNFYASQVSSKLTSGLRTKCTLIKKSCKKISLATSEDHGKKDHPEQLQLGQRPEETGNNVPTL